MEIIRIMEKNIKGIETEIDRLTKKGTFDPEQEHKHLLERKIEFNAVIFETKALIRIIETKVYIENNMESDMKRLIEINNDFVEKYKKFRNKDSKLEYNTLK